MRQLRKEGGTAREWKSDGKERRQTGYQRNEDEMHYLCHL